jgi:hypothetical protein
MACSFYRQYFKLSTSLATLCSCSCSEQTFHFWEPLLSIFIPTYSDTVLVMWLITLSGSPLKAELFVLLSFTNSFSNLRSHFFSVNESYIPPRKGFFATNARHVSKQNHGLVVYIATNWVFFTNVVHLICSSFFFLHCNVTSCSVCNPINVAIHTYQTLGTASLT